MNISFFSTLGKVDNLSRSAYLSWIGSGIKKITYLGEEGEELENFTPSDVKLKFLPRVMTKRPTLIELIGAICREDSDYIVQINSDIIVSKDFKDQLESVLKEYPTGGIAVRRIDVKEKPNCQTVEQVQEYIERVKTGICKTKKLGTDLHCCSKDLWEKIRKTAIALVVGAKCWDLRIQDDLYRHATPPVDATSRLQTYHPKHAVTLDTDPDVIKNYALVGHPPLGKQCSHEGWGKIL